jgi:hypothetical protein
MARFNFLLLLSLLGASQAFVARPSVVKSPTRQATPLNVDPSHIFETASTFLADAANTAGDYIPGTSGEVSYSKYSYYTILGLYLFSFPGIWSTVKRSTSAKMKRKTYVT